MKKREIQKAIVFEWLDLFASFKEGVIKKNRIYSRPRFFIFSRKPSAG